jgi:hypothetical protein
VIFLEIQHRAIARYDSIGMPRHGALENTVVGFVVSLSAGELPPEEPKRQRAGLSAVILAGVLREPVLLRYASWCYLQRTSRGKLLKMLDLSARCLLS